MEDFNAKSDYEKGQFYYYYLNLYEKAEKYLKLSLI